MQTSAVEELETESTIKKDSIEYVPVESIIIIDRKRELSEARVTVLADSIKTIGLLQPVILTKDYHLVAGLHRTHAFIKNGEEKIPAIFKEYSSMDAELAEIDENLVRFELTDMERSIQYKRRKEIYEHKFPQTLDNKRRTELRKKWEEEGKPTDHPEIPDFGSEEASLKGVPSFVEDTANKTGRATSQIRSEAELGKRLMEELTPEIRGLLAPTKAADNKSALEELLREPDPEIRYEAAKAVRESYDESVADTTGKTKEIHLKDALAKLQKSPTYESTVSESGEETLHKTLQKTLKALELSVGSPKFKEVAETWTYDGVEDIREDFFRIEALANKAIDTLTKIMESKEKLGKTPKK